MLFCLVHPFQVCAKLSRRRTSAWQNARLSNVVDFSPGKIGEPATVIPWGGDGNYGKTQRAIGSIARLDQKVFKWLWVICDWWICWNTGVRQYRNGKWECNTHWECDAPMKEQLLRSHSLTTWQVNLCRLDTICGNRERQLSVRLLHCWYSTSTSAVAKSALESQRVW